MAELCSKWIQDPVTAFFSDIITRGMDMVALTNCKPPPKDPKIINSSVRWGTESRSREVVWVSALQGYCRGSDPQRHSGRNPLARAKPTPTLLIMIIINYKDRAELPQPEPLPRKTSFSLDEKSLLFTAEEQGGS